MSLHHSSMEVEEEEEEEEEEEGDDFNTASFFSDLEALSVFYTVSVVSMLTLAFKSIHCCAKVQSGIFKFRMSSGNLPFFFAFVFFPPVRLNVLLCSLPSCSFFRDSSTYTQVL